MNEKLDLTFLQFDRHNLMNDLQIIYGFLQMNRPKEARVQVEKLMEKLSGERELIRAGIPRFSYLLFMFNYYNKNLRLSYAINVNKNLNELDRCLRKDTEQFMKVLERFASRSNLHDITVKLEELSQEKIQLSFILDDLELTDTNFKKECENCLSVKDFDIRITDEMQCTWTYYI